ncbi:MAG: V0D/AC39 family V-type ATPase subunit [Candidatus Hodarchaeales archaeon]
MLGPITEARIYSFVNARIKARRSQLLTAADYERLLTSTINEGLSFLQSNPRYVNTGLDSLDTESSDFFKELEAILYGSVHNELVKLAKNIPVEAKSFITVYLKRYYLDALKSAIRIFDVRKSVVPPKLERFFFITPEETEEVLRVSQARDIDEVIQTVQVIWAKKALSEVKDEYKKSRDVIILENALDRAYYSVLWNNKITKLKGTDKKIVKKFIGTEIDLQNINIMLRCFQKGINPEAILSELIPISYQLDSIFTVVARSFSLDDALQKLESTTYESFLERITSSYHADGNLLRLDQIQQEHYIQVLYGITAGYPFHIGIFLLYLVLRLQEIENLRIIFESKKKEMALDFTRELLLYFK